MTTPSEDPAGAVVAKGLPTSEFQGQGEGQRGHRRKGLVATTNINRVVLTGNLTRDPELRSLPSGTAVCTLRIASNTRRKDASTGEWGDKPNYFDVTVWGAAGEACARFLRKGREVAVDGRLEWREFETREGQKRDAIEIIADNVEFLSAADDRSDAQPAQRASPDPSAAGPPPAGDAPGDDDIPF